jgi:hypothetical protein
MIRQRCHPESAVGGWGREIRTRDSHTCGMAGRKLDPRVLTVLVVLHVVVATFTWRDIKRRDAEQIRGPKWLWRLASAVQMGNALAYWLFGRKRANRAAV